MTKEKTKEEKNFNYREGKIKQLLDKLDKKMIQDSASLDNQHYLTYHLELKHNQPPFNHLYFAEITPKNGLSFIFSVSDIPYKDYETQLTVQTNDREYLFVLNFLLQCVPCIVDANGKEVTKDA